MTFPQFVTLQDQLVGFLWPAIELWLILFVAGGFLLALYHAMTQIVRAKFL